MNKKTNGLGSVNWEWEIKPETSWRNISLTELYTYKDLLLQLTRKEFLGSYQQTLLGPFWALLQPLLTVLTYSGPFYPLAAIIIIWYTVTFTCCRLSILFFYRTGRL